jgi:NAD(P)-dependent dehydrogenase (short-subunit alcohol dehydrogenase family)
MAKWTADDITDQSGKTFIVTGANSGLGLETTRALLGAGARVIMACRSRDKAEEALAEIAVDTGTAEIIELDLSSLDSVRGFAAAALEACPQIDVLLNNAGVMMPPLSRTAEGFELQIGTNHLGHFALTGLLLDRLEDTPGARVVTITSLAARIGKIRFDGFKAEDGYARTREYGRSKLANLMFALELAERLEQRGSEIRSVAAHPGYSSTNLQDGTWYRFTNPVFAQAAWRGALPGLYAATADTVENGDFYGPDGLFELRGYPAIARVPGRAIDAEVRDKLWEVSEQLTDVSVAAAA